MYDSTSNSLSVRAVSTPLTKILEEIAARANISITAYGGSFGDRVSVRIAGSPLETALRQILGGFNLAFIYESDGEGAVGAKDPRLAQLIVVPREPTPSGMTSVSVERFESPRSVERVPVPADDFVLVRGLIEGSVEMVRAIVETLKQPASEHERARVVHALLDRLQDQHSPLPDGVITALKDLAPERATELLLQHLRAGDPVMQNRAAAYLWRFADERAVEPLSRVLWSASSETRRAAATSLALIGGSRAFEVLLQAYQATDDRIRYPAWLAIVSHGSPQSQARLANLIAKGNAPPARPVEKPLPQ